MDRANPKDSATQLSLQSLHCTGPRDASQSLLQEEQDGDEDDDNFVDICVTDTQQCSSIPSPFENAGEAPLASGACSVGASASSAPTTFSIPNHSGNAGEKFADSQNNDYPTDKGIQEPDPSQRSSPPSPSPFHFPYTSDSVCGTPMPLKVEKSPSPSRTRIITSADMAAESQSSCTELSHRGTREETLSLSQPGSVDPEFGEKDVAESQLSQGYLTSQELLSSGVLADASQTVQTSIAVARASASQIGGGGDCCRHLHALQLYLTSPSFCLSLCLPLSPCVLRCW